MKRPHAEQAIAWFGDDEMIVLRKTLADEWVLAETPQWYEGVEYFTCQRSHLPAVLALLNGGEAQISCSKASHWDDIDLGVFGVWSAESWYMNDQFESRVKPKKQKRYAYAYPNGFVTYSFEDKDELDKRYFLHDGQLITFEIEL
jgi:hypothetical protein